MNWIRNAIVGAVISLAISYISVSVSSYYQNVQMGPIDLLQEMIVALILGLVIGAMTVVFQIGTWSLLKSVFVHLIGTLLAVLLAGYIAHWYIWSWQSVGKLLLYFAIIYSIIWLIQFWGMKRDVEDVNEFIQKKSQQ